MRQPKNRTKICIAVACIASALLIAMVCLFLIKPFGQIHLSAIAIVSDLLFFAAALLNVKIRIGKKFKIADNECEITNSS